MTALSDAIQEYLDSRKARGKKPGTIKNDRVKLQKFLTAVGNIQVHNITGQHIDMHFAARPHIGPGTFNQDRSALERFFKWSRARRYMPKNVDPMEGITPLKTVEPPRIFVPRDRFDELLDAPDDRRDRMVIALGLYLLMGAAEIRLMRWEHVHIDDPNPKAWRVEVWRSKTSTYSKLICVKELADELRRWKMEYAAQMGETVQPKWHVVPAYHRRYFVKGAKGRLPAKQLNPTASFTHCDEAVQRALRAIGYESTLGEGNHTLRRSGGLAWYHELSTDIAPIKALRWVQYMMQHASVTQTEKYLRLSEEELEIADALAGQLLFRHKEAEVIDLGQADSRTGEL